MNVNAGHERTSKARIIHQIQLIRGITVFRLVKHRTSYLNGKRLVRTVLIFTERSDQLSRATDRVPGLPASPGYAQ
nr:hypothetical protein [Shigella dysenteriae]